MATSNFAFEVKDILGLEITHLESWVAKKRVKWPQCIIELRTKNIFWVYSWQLATLILRSRPYWACKVLI